MQVIHCAGRILANTRSCAGMTGRWGLLSHAQNAVRWLHAIKMERAESQEHRMQSNLLSYIAS